MSRAHCVRCDRPAVVCVCAHVTQVPTRTRVVVLQHPRESEVAINTIRLARLALPSMRVFVGDRFEPTGELGELLDDASRKALLLYPSPEARELRTVDPAQAHTLVMIDGTWAQAASVRKLNPWLSRLEPVRFQPSAPSNYRLRREPEEHCVASIEALTEALGVLEGAPERVRALLAPFDAMVEQQLAYAEKGRALPSRHAAMRARAPKPRPVPPALRAGLERAVLLVGECDCWPYDANPRPPPDLVHVVARRLGDGALFDGVARPRGALAPGTHVHLELPREELESAEPLEALRRRWHEWLPPDALVLLWGQFTRERAALAGLWERDPAVPTLDLRIALADWLGERPGPLDSCAERVGATPSAPWARGRAGRRAATLEALLGVLLQEAHG